MFRNINTIECDTVNDLDQALHNNDHEERFGTEEVIYDQVFCIDQQATMIKSTYAPVPIYHKQQPVTDLFSWNFPAYAPIQVPAQQQPICDQIMEDAQPMPQVKFLLNNSICDQIS